MQKKRNLRIFLIGATLILLVSAAWVITSWLQWRATLRERTAQYTAGLLPSGNKDDVFCPEAGLAYYDSLSRLTTNTPRQQMTAEYFKADALVKLGEEKEAIRLLTHVIELLKMNPGQAPAADPRRYLALAWLRLGERNNCLTGHTSGSCIFPIRGNGVYRDSSASQRAITIYRQLLTEDPGDLQLRWLLNIAYMTLGQYPGNVPQPFLIPGLDKDTSSIKFKPFTDRAMELGLAPSRNEAGGTIVDDFDGDGYLDIVFSDWDPLHGMHFFRNNGDGTFSDRSESSGLSRIKGAFNLLQVDYNNDGLLDIFILRGGWRGNYGNMPKTLLRNNGDGTFTDVTVASGILSLHPTQTGVWADFNNDGWPDLFIGQETMSIYNPHPCELWINNRDGSFTNVAKAAGCDLLGFVKGVAAADYDHDGLPDLFLSRRDGKKTLLRNKGVRQGIPEFEDVTHQAGLDKDTTNTFPTWFWDYDNDGWPDIFVCGYQFAGSLAGEEAASALGLPIPSAGTMYLYRNNHDGTFTNVTKTTGLARPVFAMGANFGDFDNDGWPDMYLGTGNPDFESLMPNRMFKNVGGKSFVDVTRSVRVGNLQKGHGVAIADVDNNGTQDIFIELGGAYVGDAYYNAFYVNPGQNDNNWIAIDLEGTRSCRSAFGAHIAVRFTEDGVQRVVYRDVNSGGSFGASPLRQEIGIGKAAQIDELKIEWPATGLVQRFTHIAPRQFLKIREGDKSVTVLAIHPLTWRGKAMPMDMTGGMPGTPAALRAGGMPAAKFADGPASGATPAKNRARKDPG